SSESAWRSATKLARWSSAARADTGGSGPLPTRLARRSAFRPARTAAAATTSTATRIRRTPRTPGLPSGQDLDPALEERRAGRLGRRPALGVFEQAPHLGSEQVDRRRR